MGFIGCGWNWFGSWVAHGVALAGILPGLGDGLRAPSHGWVELWVGMVLVVVFCGWCYLFAAR